MQPWRLLDLGAYNASANMAIDEAMLSACIRQQDRVKNPCHSSQDRVKNPCHSSNSAPATVRFYTWSPPAVSIGCLQRIRGNFDPNQAEKLGLTMVRRPTGGRLVLHKGDLTYSLVFTEDNPRIPGGVLASYQKIGQAVQRGLWRLGIPAQLCPERKISPSPFCFSGVARYEILVHGRKIMGNAQKRTKGACLQQGSIMLEDQQELIHQLFPPNPGDTSPLAEGSSRAGGTEYISLEEAFGNPVAVSLVKEALIRGFEEIFHISFTFGSLTVWEEEEAARLMYEKYSQDLWNKEGHL